MNNYTTASAEIGKTHFSLDEMKAAMQLGRNIRRDMDASLEGIRQIRCLQCGRKIETVNRGFGDTLVMCRHLFEALKRQCTQDVAQMPQQLNTLYGLHIEVKD